eukprot:Gb_31800 [translate_table: standard]
MEWRGIPREGLNYVAHLSFGVMGEQSIGLLRSLHCLPLQCSEGPALHLFISFPFFTAYEFPVSQRISFICENALNDLYHLYFFSLRCILCPDTSC